MCQQSEGCCVAEILGRSVTTNVIFEKEMVLMELDSFIPKFVVICS